MEKEEAIKKVEEVEEKTGIKYNKKQREKAIKQFMGEIPWFD